MPKRNLSLDLRLDRICNEFEDVWSPDTRVDFEDYLHQVEANHRDDLLRALVEVDVELRQRNGQAISKDDYANLGAPIQAVVEALLAESGNQAPFETIQRLCHDFQSELSNGNSPLVGDYAKRVNEGSRAALVRNLLHIDISHRRSLGQIPDTMDYTRDMPEQAALVSSVFYETAVSMFDTGSALSSADQTSSPAPTHGNLLGEYQLLGELGRGGMGAVFEARHTKRGHHVALKILPTVDGRSLQYFKGEFRRMAEINHPNLIGLQTLQADGGVWFFTMELVRGTDLFSYVRPDNKCDSARLRTVLPQMAAALFKLHSENIIHCDLKPSNVLVDQEGRVVVLDFGLAFKGGKTDHISADRIAGTPAYMAPEQAAGGSVTGAADWYAVGVMLYQMLTGKLPVTGDSMLELMQRKQAQPASQCKVSDESLSDLANLANELLAIDALKRPNALEIAERLTSTTDDSTVITAKSETVLVGREKQIALLRSAFEKVQCSSTPSIVFVNGRSGEGKTSLVEHFISKLKGHHVALSGRCYDRESVPFKALDGLIDRLTNHLRGLAEAEAALLMPDDIGFLAQLFPVLNRVDVVRKLKGGSGAALDQQQVRTRAFAALKALLTRLTRTAPLVLFADDLQWGDDDSAEALVQILCTGEPPPLMFVGTYRSDEMETSPFIAKWRQLTQDVQIQQDAVSVSPLSIDECTQLAVQIIGEDNARIRQMVFQFASQTGGNPMLFIELISCYDPAADSFEALPIEELIARKLNRLPKSAKPLLEFLAVAGQRSSLDEIAIASETQQESEAVATALRSEKLIRMTGEGQFISIDTYHDKIREAVLRYLTDGVRSEIHGFLGLALETACEVPELQQLRRALEEHQELSDKVKERLFDLSYHFDALGDREKAYVYACLAARQASDQFSQSVAAEQYSVAKRNMDAANSRDSFWVARGLGRAECLLGNYEKAKHEIEDAVNLTTDQVEQAEILGLRAEIEFKMGAIGEGVHFYSEAIRKLGYFVPKRALTGVVSFCYELFVQLSHSLLPAGWYKKDRELSKLESLAVEMFNRNSIGSYSKSTMTMLWTHIKGLNLAETRKDSLGLAYSYGLHPAPAAAVGLADRGLRYSDRAIEIADAEGDMLTLGHIFTMRSMGFFTIGEYSQGVEAGIQGGNYVKSAGDPYLQFLSEIHATLCYSELGMPDKAIPLGIECFERSLKFGQNTGMAGSLYILTLAAGGRLPHSALRTCFTIDDENHFDHSLTNIGEGVWHLRHDRYAEAVAALEESWLSGRRNFVVTPYTIAGISWLLAAIRLQRMHSTLSNGEDRQLLKKAQSYMRQARLLSRMCPTAKPRLYREIGLFHKERGQRNKAMVWLTRSMQLADRFGSVLERSKTIVKLQELNSEINLPVDQAKIDDAIATLERIERETDEVVSKKWRTENTFSR